MTPETVTTYAGVVLSLAFSYVPKLKDKYAALDATQKRLTMLGVLALVVVAQFGLSCGKVAIPGVVAVSCDQAGAVSLVNLLIGAVIANQATYLLSPR